MEELRNEAYESSRIYKAKMKVFHDKNISRKTFEPVQKVWLFNSRMWLFSGKLKFRWDGSFVVDKVFEVGAVRIVDPKSGTMFKVNAQRLKPYTEEVSESRGVENFSLSDPVASG
ncbi:PREDICTED: uncharacterized protein LOC104608141 [Nelumbo nucifera]|uniref:Uncharacterized protein LOC104608141 n=1 Tax=Nelumbo nucifera TaxID=4432 RepID=A0A1U8AWD7_NELNU|nr:PREDICTED: uncharacterized protein LOC104608141 [Nelumbo nucifera]